MEQELISVIIPTYNRMNTLPRSVGSVLQQTYKNFELIIIDDCSTDETKQYIDSLEDTRIRYFRNEKNLGAAESRNVGAELASGNYLAFQDSDDEWLPDKLMVLYEILKKDESGAGAIYHEMQEIGGKEEIIPSRGIPADVKQGDIFSFMLLYPLIGIPATMMKKEIFQEIGGFNSKLGSLEDYEFFLRIAKKHNILFVPQPFIKIYDSADSVNKRWKDKIDTEIYVIEEFYSDFTKYDLLQKKIELVRLQATNYDCEEYFYHKILELCKAGDSNQSAKLLDCLELAEVKKENSCSDKGNYYREVMDHLLHVVDSLSRLQNNISVNPAMLSQNYLAIFDAVCDTARDMTGYCEFGDHPVIQRNEMESLHEKLSASKGNAIVLKQLLDELLLNLKKLLTQIGSTQYICGACGSKVKMLPLSPYRKVMREFFGFQNEKVHFIFEKEDCDCCPVCGSDTETRFLLNFMGDIQSENGEILQVACEDGVKWNLSDAIIQKNSNIDEILQRYLEIRENAEYVVLQEDLSDMEAEACAMNENKADVLLCPNILEYVAAPDMVMGYIRNHIKDNGVAIITIGALCDEEKDVKGNCDSAGEKGWKAFGLYNAVRGFSEEQLQYFFEENGFVSTIIDVNWFGLELYKQMAFPQLARVYMLQEHDMNVNFQ